MLLDVKITLKSRSTNTAFVPDFVNPRFSSSILRSATFMALILDNSIDAKSRGGYHHIVAVMSRNNISYVD